MSLPHFDVLPTLALHLAVEAESYRRAVREMVRNWDDLEASHDAAEALKLAREHAFALPALWASWGEVMVRHATLMRERMRRAPNGRLQRAWRDLEIRIEIVEQRCIEWALNGRESATIGRAAAEAFLAWDQTRREAFEVARHIAALREDHPTDLAIAQLRDRHAAYVQLSDRLFDAARAELEQPPGPEAGAPQPPAGGTLRFHALHDRWRLAEEVAAAAESAIVEMDLRGLEVTAAQRNVAAMLRAVALELRTATLDAGQL